MSKIRVLSITRWVICIVNALVIIGTLFYNYQKYMSINDVVINLFKLPDMGNLIGFGINATVMMVFILATFIFGLLTIIFGITISLNKKKGKGIFYFILTLLTSVFQYISYNLFRFVEEPNSLYASMFVVTLLGLAMLVVSIMLTSARKNIT